MDVLISKFTETVSSVLPVSVLVLLLHFFVTPLPGDMVGRFLVGTVFIVMGLSIFLLGVDIAIQPVGNAIGSKLASRKSLLFLIVGGVILGFSINIAEPDLLVLAKQIAEATGNLISLADILVVVSIGVGIMLAIALLRIVFQMKLRNVLFLIYIFVFALAVATPNDFLGIAFDAGGATTGSMTVPFVLALGLGVSAVNGSGSSEEDAFGLTAIASGGPMLAVMSMALIRGLKGVDEMEEATEETVHGILSPFLHAISHQAQEVLLAILPLVLITILCQRLVIRLPRRTFRRIVKGFVYTYIGFVLFLTGVNAGFMDAGLNIGYQMAELPLSVNLIVSAIIGCVVILAEPSVHVLTSQIEEITDGAIKRSSILISFAVGVSLAVTLSVLRLHVEGLELWLMLLIGYVIAIVLSRFTPSLFVGIAFDSGGVASGPMTATFVLAFVQGIALQIYGDGGLIEAFGVIALVALIPLITLQIFGLIYEHSRRVKYAEDHGGKEDLA